MLGSGASEQRGVSAGLLPLIGVVMLAVILVSAGVTLAFDRRCAAQAAVLLPPYPNATLEEQSFTFLRLYGVGLSSQTFSTPDDAASVRRFYSDVSRMAAANPLLRRRTIEINRQISTLSTGGSRIQFDAVCARALDLSPLGISLAPPPTRTHAGGA